MALPGRPDMLRVVRDPADPDDLPVESRLPGAVGHCPLEPIRHASLEPKELSMGFRSRPDIEAEIVSTRRLQPFVSKQGLDVPDRAPVKQERRGHRVPQHMRGHSLLEARQPRKPLEGRLHGVVSQAVWRVPSRDEEGLFVVSPATEIAFKPLHRSVGEEEHPLLVPFPMILTSLRPASTSHRSSARISDIRAPVPRSGTAAEPTESRPTVPRV